MKWLLQFFTWWSGQTLNTRFNTWRTGELVGQDEFGNVYYRAPNPYQGDPSSAERRWVIYNGEAELSRVPPAWRGWLAHTHDEAPSDAPYTPRALAFRSPGSEGPEAEADL